MEIKEIKTETRVVFPLLDHIKTVERVLLAYREDLIPKGDESYDEEWGEITYAWAKIIEALELDDYLN